MDWRWDIESMPKYIAFLRAINVGGHVVKMDQLRHLFEGLGFSNVETLIASGNLIFDSKSRTAQTLEKKIEDYLEEALGYKVATFIRSPSDLAALVQYKPFVESELNAEGNTLYIGFLGKRPSDEGIRGVLALTTAVDDFHVHEREVYWLRRRTVGESNFSGALLERALRMQATFRNLNTVKRLASKYS
jgi:uncharacterized protein (DUF1697 family)